MTEAVEGAVREIGTLAMRKGEVDRMSTGRREEGALPVEEAV